MRTGIAKLCRNLAGYLRWAAWDGVMAPSIFTVCERVSVAMGAVSIVLCTLGGAWYTEGKRERVRRAIGSSGLVVGMGGIGMSGGFGMTTLGSGAGGRSYKGRRICLRIEPSWARGCKYLARGGFALVGLLLVVQRWIA